LGNRKKNESEFIAIAIFGVTQKNIGRLMGDTWFSSLGIMAEVNSAYLI